MTCHTYRKIWMCGGDERGVVKVFDQSRYYKVITDVRVEQDERYNNGEQEVLISFPVQFIGAALCEYIA